jgi:hypothetical protein
MRPVRSTHLSRVRPFPIAHALLQPQAEICGSALSSVFHLRSSAVEVFCSRPFVVQFVSIRGSIRVHSRFNSCAFAIQFVSIRGYFCGSVLGCFYFFIICCCLSS